MNLDRRLSIIGRIVAALAMFAMSAVCVLGFMASFEFPGITRWHIMYGGLFITLLFFIVRVLRPVFVRPRPVG